jgi:hypothetical protein
VTAGANVVPLLPTVIRRSASSDPWEDAEQRINLADARTALDHLRTSIGGDADLARECIVIDKLLDERAPTDPREAFKRAQASLANKRPPEPPISLVLLRKYVCLSSLLFRFGWRYIGRQPGDSVANTTTHSPLLTPVTSQVRVGCDDCAREGGCTSSQPDRRLFWGFR